MQAREFAACLHQAKVAVHCFDVSRMSSASIQALSVLEWHVPRASDCLWHAISTMPGIHCSCLIDVCTCCQVLRMSGADPSGVSTAPTSGFAAGGAPGSGMARGLPQVHPSASTSLLQPAPADHGNLALKVKGLLWSLAWQPQSLQMAMILRRQLL